MFREFYKAKLPYLSKQEFLCPKQYFLAPSPFYCLYTPFKTGLNQFLFWQAFDNFLGVYVLYKVDMHWDRDF